MFIRKMDEEFYFVESVLRGGQWWLKNNLAASGSKIKK